MGDIEHLVKVYPIRLESPVIVSGKRYQIAFVRGKTKAKAPRAISSTESCFINFESLGCFSQAVVHFKENKKKQTYQPKIVSFEFFDCSVDPHGARIGDAEIDVAALMREDGTCNTEVRHPFRMCGFGATFVVCIVVQKIVNGKPVGGDVGPLPASTNAAVEVSQRQNTTSSVGNDRTDDIDAPSKFYLPRDAAIGVLSRVEEYAKAASVTSRQLAAATAGGSVGLQNILNLAHDVSSVNIKHIPDRTLLKKDSVEREANKYSILISEKDPASADLYLRQLLEQSRERLKALRRAENLLEIDEQQIITSLGCGTPTSMEIERDPPLPLLLFCRKFTDARATVDVPSSPHVTQPPVSVQLPLKYPPKVAAIVDSVSTAVKTEKANAASAIKSMANQVSSSENQSFDNMFGGPTAATAGVSSTSPKEIQAKAQMSPADLVPNLFDSPSNRKSATQSPALKSQNQKEGLGTDMFSSAVERSSASATAAAAAVRMEGLTMGMFTNDAGGGGRGSHKSTPKACPVIAAPGADTLSAGMFGMPSPSTAVDSRPSTNLFESAPPDTFGGLNFGTETQSNPVFGATEKGSGPSFGGFGDRESVPFTFLPTVSNFENTNDTFGPPPTSIRPSHETGGEVVSKGSNPFGAHDDGW